jgi:predicted HTH transcriptional regulator
MTKEELLLKLTDIEWDDFECKSCQNKLSEDVWATVSAFSNTSGGWIVFGIKQVGKKFEIQGVNNGEKTESDFLNTLRSEKFNLRLSAKGMKYNFDGKLVLAFHPAQPKHHQVLPLCQIRRECGLWHRQDAGVGATHQRQGGI